MLDHFVTLGKTPWSRNNPTGTIGGKSLKAIITYVSGKMLRENASRVISHDIFVRTSQGWIHANRSYTFIIRKIPF